MNYENYNSIEDILFAKGMTIGIAEGIAEEKIKIIKKMLSADAINMNTKEIAQFLEVNESEVKKIKRELDRSVQQPKKHRNN